MIKNWKRFNESDEIDPQTIKGYIGELSSQMARLKQLLSIKLKRDIPVEDLKDVFLGIAEQDNLRLFVDKTDFIITVYLRGLIDEDRSEDKFNEYVFELTKAKDKLARLYNFKSHFKISINYKIQGMDNNPKTHINDIYYYTGPGDEKEYYGPSSRLPIPKGKVHFGIEFFIV